MDVIAPFTCHTRALGLLFGSSPTWPPTSIYNTAHPSPRSRRIHGAPVSELSFLWDQRRRDYKGSRAECYWFSVGSLAMEEQFWDKAEDVIRERASTGLNPGLVVLLVIGGLVLLFLVGNYALYTYAQKTLPAKKKKPVSKKRMKKERLKQGVSAPGE